MASDPDRILRHEARATIKKELHRRKQDIRQRTDFLIAALRAQCMTMINELPASVRKMTMREFCHVYGADTAAYLRQEAKRRMQKVIQEQHQPRQDYQEKSQIHDDDKDPSRDDHVHQDHQEQHGKQQRQSLKDVHDPEQHDKQRQQQQSIKDVHDPEQHDKQQQQDHSTKDPEHQHPEQQTQSISIDHDQDFSLQLGPSLQYEGTSYDDNDPPLGPLFLHMERQNHPRVRFQLNPLQTVDQLGEFSIDIPRETIEQMTSQQRARICQQIQDIQNKLENAKSYFEQ
ncbi:hypothetical protein LRAMOSA06717 [Lichtheimia ramosa]|uniref:Borealin N-terminal domain-containing protein n=1 Tax=Lichtheimia ramosa TaxID=688394 RepID=A0A077X570_9FUNG|nr:hypothetical protein LRAMOSA06717 [Lichtheimia ramosa]